MKNKTIIPTKEQKRIIKISWLRFVEIENEFYDKLNELEKIMEAATKIEGIEFFSCDGEYMGVGNADRTMKLIHLK
jgi:hypothetical protein